MQMHNQPPPTSGPPGLFWANKWLSKVEDLFAIIAALCIFFLMFLGIGQVLGRQLFNMPFMGYIDLVELSMSTFAFLAVSYCQRLGGHVRMDLFVRMVHGRTRWILEFITTAAPLILVGLLIYFSWGHFMRAYESGDSTIDLQYPVWPSKILVPIALAVLFLRLLIETIGYWRLVLKPDSEPFAVPLILTEEDLAKKEIEDSKGSADRG
jgi:TRAP-type C4-dicarboxylate transport system permease small subunit